MRKVFVINGPNLSLLGKRRPAVYGTQSLSEIIEKLKEISKKNSCDILDFQSNCEGEIVSFLNREFLNSENSSHLAGIIINAGAYTHTSIAIADALEVFMEKKIPIYEVHLSNIFSREKFRHTSYISPIATGVICGCGADGYEMALKKILSG